MTSAAHQSACDDMETARRDRLRATLTGLAPAYRKLCGVVVSRVDRGPASSFGSPALIDTVAFDVLHHPDHEGHPGLIPALTSAALITRLALGHLPADARPRTEEVPDAVRYLAAQLDMILDALCWNQAAAGEVLTLADQTISRIDTERLRVDFREMQRAAQHRLAEIEHTDEADQDEVAALHFDLQTDYVDFEGRLFDAAQARYERAAASAAGWADYLTAEINRLSIKAAAVLGTAAHSTRGLIACPWCTRAIGLSRDDPDLAVCAGCARSWRLSDGTAELHFTAWRDAGWTPQHWRDTA